MAGFLLTPGRLLATVVSVIALSCSLLAATPPRIVLVGDSTVTDHGGWGAGFRRFVSPAATVENTAAGGRSSKSFIDEGRWAKALALKGDYYLIQFGHNDQPGKGPTRETDPETTFTANMARYVDEVRAIGGQPVLVTSLTRRNFDPVHPTKINSTLTPYVEAVKKLALAKNVPLIDLHATSIAYVEHLGPTGTAQFDVVKDGKPDTTHLDAAGSVVFAKLVVERLREAVPALAPVLRAEPDMDRDVEYGVAGGVSLKLDAHTPPGEGPFPIAILVHGGGWNSGDKAGSDKPGNGADITPWFAPLSAAKFTWFSINYRMAPAHRWPACFDDVQTAIRWARTNAAKFKGDPSRIVIFGHSAGGHLATLAGALGEGDTRVQAVVGYAPVTDFIYELPARGGLGKALQDLHGQPKEPNETSLAILRDTAAINHVKPGLPPFLLLHGDADKTVPYQTSLNFQAKLREAGVTADLITLPGAGHGLLQWEKFLPDYAQQMTAWLERTLPATTGPAPAAPPDAVVSADNSGTHTSVQAAINAAPAGRTMPWVILVKPGRYREHLHVPADKPWITLRGDSADDTIITLDRNLATLDANGKKFSTPDSATVLVDAANFLAENLTFENTTPREAKIQALAMYVRADRAVFRRCRFLGWQDTLRADSPRPANVTEPDAPRPDGNARHHFVDCYIEGHVDFIYAAGTSVFERCELHVKADGYITAASTPEAAPFGYVFLDCKVTAGPAVEKGFYLGRPWRAHAATAFIRTALPAQLLPAGWHNWGKVENEKTARYAEFGSTGPGANPAARVPWAKPLTADEAAAFTVEKILAGRDAWDPTKR